jgi:Right handed beta helix region
MLPSVTVANKVSSMLHVVPRLAYVSASDPTAAYPSISAALRHAAPGDTILVGAGYYAPSRTGERFPLYVPPGVTLMGVGQGESIIDGEGALEVSFRPVQAGQSLVLLGDGSAVSGFTITGSGGNGLGIEPGARVCIMRNAIHRHGQHGIIVSGPQEAIIKDNRFLDNGTRQFRPETPQPAAGRQGHHIFVQGKGGAANRVIIANNTMRGAFADAVALVVFFDEPDAVSMHVSILSNDIEQSQRRGLTIAGSFGPSHTRVIVDIRHNSIRQTANQAIAAYAARPLARQLLRDCMLQLRITDNICVQNGGGIALFGGVGPAEDNVLDSTIIGNRFTGIQGHALRLIGGVGVDGYSAHRNRLQAIISHNHLEDVHQPPMLLQGGIITAREEATGNAVFAQICDNTLPLEAGKPPVLLNDGLPGNTVHLAEPAPPHERVLEVIPYLA